MVCWKGDYMEKVKSDSDQKYTANTGRYATHSYKPCPEFGNSNFKKRFGKKCGVLTDILSMYIS